MEDSVCVVSPKKARKRIRQPDKWKNNVAKQFKYSPTSLPESPSCKHDTKAFQCSRLKMRDLLAFHTELYKIKSKTNQDCFLVNCISTQQIKPTSFTREPRSMQLKFHVMRCDGVYVPVRKQAFLKILQITRARVDYVAKNFIAKCTVPTEKRGGDRKSRMFNYKKEAVKTFIRSLNCIESHYCRGKSVRKYLSSDFSINKLCSMYNEKAPSDELKVKKPYFRHVFNTNFNLGFKSPKTDVCSTCIVLDEKLKMEKDPDKKALLMVNKRVHKLRAKCFYKLLRDKDENLLILSFDMQKNLPLPKVPDQQAYYSRQLYLHNFTVVQGHSKTQLNKSTCTSYCWTEEEFAKGSNQIASAVFHKLNSNDLKPFNKVRLMADACWGQNKNQAIICMCSKWLLDAPNNIKCLELIFPVRGHSFIPPDRVSGKIESDVRKHEVIANPDEYLEIIGNRTTIQNFGEDCQVKDWLGEAKRVFKHTGSWHFKISLCKRFMFQRSKRNIHNILVKGEEHYNTSLTKLKSICKMNYQTIDINPTEIKKGNMENVKPQKIEDVQKLLYIHYGEAWRYVEKLGYFKKVIEDYNPALNAVPHEEGILCEPEQEAEEFEMNLVTVYNFFV